MPLSEWMKEWYGSIEKDFDDAVDRASRIELRCPPEKTRGSGTWQKLREVLKP